MAIRGLVLVLPKFLGVAVQLAKRFTGGTAKYSSSAEECIEEVNKSLKRFLQFSSKRDMSMDSEEFIQIFPEMTPFVIEKCCDFTPKLRDIPEREGIPVIHLTQEICKKYKNVDITKESSQYCRAFNRISESYKRMAKNLTNLS